MINRKHLRFTALSILLLSTFSSLDAAGQQTVMLQEPWQSQYTKANAAGKHVLGLWTFDETDAGEDLSGNGHTAKFKGAKVESQGRFGAALRSFPGFPVEDKRHYAIVKDSPKLSPQGPFTLEMWINPGKDIEKAHSAFLLDKKYAGHTDYQLLFNRAGSSGTRILKAVLGFGASSETWYSDPLKLKPGTWYHIVFLYDGAGRGRFLVNGIPHGEKTISGIGSVAAGTRPLTIGDRNGSNYGGFPGLVDQVRISEGELEFRPVRFERISQRACFIRMEKNCTIAFQVTNLQKKLLPETTVTWLLNGEAQGTSALKNLQTGQPQEVLFPLNTSLRPDQYLLTAKLKTAGPLNTSAEESFPIQIVSRKLPDQFPVIMWGAGISEIDRLKEIGFTHAAGLRANYSKIFKAGKPALADSEQRVTEVRAGLDRGLANGISFYASLSPGTYLRNQEKYQRMNRDGTKKSSREDICASIPAIKEYCYNVGASVVQTYQDYPAFDSALLHTEVRGHSRPCFHQHDLEAFKKHAGFDVPAEVGSPYGVSYSKLKDFPKNRVVKDDHPLYVYYKWHWKKGDGWNDLNSDLERGLNSTDKTLWTWYDPAMRVATVFGSGGNVDVLSHWTYTYPDPIRINVVLDEMFAMARGSKKQQDVMKMTQIIWYRSQTAPKPKKPEDIPATQATWEQEQPDADFITISPMQLREAFWAKISRPIKGIMYHGWQSLVPTDGTYAYRLTNTQTQHELKRLIHEVVQPLGPTLRNIPAAKNDIAFYESFASQVFARRGTLGWNGYWLGDAHQMLQWAGLQTDVVFDETITQQGLDQYKVLVIMHGDVVTKSVLKKIEAFQQRGGLVIADEFLTPAIQPDIRVRSYSRTGKADVDKQEFQKKAMELKAALSGKYNRFVDSSNQNVVHYSRRGKITDYIFLVNDHREYGKYVGHHGRVMENGLPSETTLSINRGEGYLYDLVNHQPVLTQKSAGKQTFSLQLGPGAGGIYMLMQDPIERITVDVPDQLKRGESANVSLNVTSQHGKPVSAVIPVEVTIEDSEGRIAEQSGFRALVDGKQSFPIQIAPNDKAGIWRVHVKELASGKTSDAHFRVMDDNSSVKPNYKNIKGFNPAQPAG
ncbi:LamG-like jellyroll fold domain-containing protein [Gimesia aquarii]|uniref:LamG-like jellyroll fold domain-containing protein n=1 Tax=Gimesia aquarii TaxID=2527964 RepID=A0A517W0H8_9PLAN|nr:LamG-like jellyroll fold domain-containing protein [Gimesia aquarii]QDT98758.1 hypothetical protein V144x_42650 [Gimesia aquarii]